VGALATAALTLAALAAGGALATPATAAGATSVSLYPTNALTVPDAGQLTGRHIALPTAGCASVPACGLVARLNELDGFDLDPRLALRFDGPVAVGDVIASTTVTGAGLTVGIDRVVYDAATHTVYAHPTHQLDPGTTYRLDVSSARGLPQGRSYFSTLSAPDGLLDLRCALDTGRAYREAGIPDAQRGLTIDAVVPTTGLTLRYNAETDTTQPLVSTDVPVAASGTVVFGSYLAPTWLRPDRTLEQKPTGEYGPVALGAERLPFVLSLPAGRAPAGGWPTTVFGHGFTRTDGDVLLASFINSSNGVATIGTDVVGHGYGPRSTWTATVGGRATTIPAHARGIDLNGDHAIGLVEGSSTLPDGAAAAVSSRDGLRQTAADVMTLVRAVSRGLDVSGSPASDLRTTDIGYFGQSFGGIYGAMVAGSDPMVSRSVLNVAGGPITEVARLSPSFRPLVAQSLSYAGLLNSSDPAKVGFDESLPLRGQPPVLHPVPGALAIQQFLADTTWLDRSGGPETYAPRIPKDRTLFQVAFGDQTVSNPTAYTLLEAGRLFERTALYRNDRVPATAGTNPHGFLLDLRTFTGPAIMAQLQVQTFLTTGVITDPDGTGNVWEVPLRRQVLLPLNFTSPTFP